MDQGPRPIKRLDALFDRGIGTVGLGAAGHRDHRTGRGDTRAGLNLDPGRSAGIDLPHRDHQSPWSDIEFGHHAPDLGQGCSVGAYEQFEAGAGHRAARADDGLHARQHLVGRPVLQIDDLQILRKRGPADAQGERQSQRQARQTSRQIMKQGGFPRFEGGM